MIATAIVLMMASADDADNDGVNDDKNDSGGDREMIMLMSEIVRVANT